MCSRVAVPRVLACLLCCVCGWASEWVSRCVIPVHWTTVQRVCLFSVIICCCCFFFVCFGDKNLVIDTKTTNPKQIKINKRHKKKHNPPSPTVIILLDPRRFHQPLSPSPPPSLLSPSPPLPRNIWISQFADESFNDTESCLKTLNAALNETMNQEALSFTLTQINHLASNLNKKNFEQNSRQIDSVIWTFLFLLWFLLFRFPFFKWNSFAFFAHLDDLFL